MSIVLEKVLFVKNPLDLRDRFIEVAEPGVPPEEVHSENNGIKTSARSNLPTVVFI